MLRENCFSRNYLIFLFLFSFFIRGVVFQFFLGKNGNFWQVDSLTYHQVAKGINNGWGFSHEKGKSCFYRLPGYPLFLSFFYNYSFGCNKADPQEFGNDKIVAMWAQIFFASFIPLLIFFLSLALFPHNLFLAKVSSFYSAIHLGLILYSGFFMSETLFIFLFLLFSIYFFKSKFFASGLFLGLASLVRPVGQYFIILAIVLTLLFIFSSSKGELKNGRNRFLPVILLFWGWIIPVSFWLLRNFMLLGHLFFHTLPGGHFLYLSAARVAMHEQDCDYWQARKNLEKESDVLIKEKEKIIGRKLNEIEHCKLLEGLALKYFLKNPIIALKNWVTDMMRTTLSLFSAELIFLYNDRKEIDFFEKKRTIWDMFRRYLFPDVQSVVLKIILFVEIFFSFFILLGFVLGLCREFFSVVKFRNLGIWMIPVSFILLFIILSLSGGYARMRLPAEPFLIILSLRFWINFFSNFRRNSNKYVIFSNK